MLFFLCFWSAQETLITFPGKWRSNVQKLGVHFLCQYGFLIEGLERFLNILLLVDEIQHEGVRFSGAGAVQAAQGLHRLHAPQLFIHDHGMQQRFVKAGLILFSHDQHMVVFMEFRLGLAFGNMAAVKAHVQLGFGIFLVPVHHGPGKRHQHADAVVALFFDIPLYLVIIAVNKLLAGRDAAIAAYELGMAKALDTTELEAQQQELLSEMEVLNGMIQQMIRQNASVAQNQTE